MWLSIVRERLGRSLSFVFLAAKVVTHRATRVGRRDIFGFPRGFPRGKYATKGSVSCLRRQARIKKKGDGVQKIQRRSLLSKNGKPAPCRCPDRGKCHSASDERDKLRESREKEFARRRDRVKNRRKAEEDRRTRGRMSGSFLQF